MKRRAVQIGSESGRKAENQTEKRKIGYRQVMISDISGVMIPTRQEQDETLAALAASIARHGLLQPVVLRPISQTGRFALICGARRLAACHLLGIKEVDALLLEASDAEAAACYLEEHMTREPPHVLDHAQLIRRTGVSRVSERFSLGQFFLQRMVRILDLPEHVCLIMRKGGLTLEQAEPILDIPDPARRLEAAQIIAERSLTPAQARRLVSGPQVQGSERPEELKGRNRRRMIRFAMEEISAVAEQLRRRGADASVAVYSREGGMCIQIMLQSGEKAVVRQEKESEARI